MKTKVSFFINNHIQTKVLICKILCGFTIRRLQMSGFTACEHSTTKTISTWTDSKQLLQFRDIYSPKHHG